MIAAWWRSLPQRDRRALGIGAVVVVALLGWVLLWRPLSHQREELHARVRAQVADLNWMRQALGRAHAERERRSHGQVSRQGKSLLALADASARGAGLGTAMKRVEPGGNGSIRVTFQAAGFDALADWLDGLARDYGVQVTDLSANKVDGVGRVDAQVTLRDSER